MVCVEVFQAIVNFGVYHINSWCKWNVAYSLIGATHSVILDHHVLQLHGVAKGNSSKDPENCSH